jgi:hypothetical protein
MMTMKRRMNSMLMVHNGRAFKEQTLGTLSGWIVEPIEELEKLPPLNYSGVKIPTRLWDRIKNFMLWSYQEFNSEAQLRLYFNENSNRWRAVAFPQYIGTGLYSEEIKDHEDRDKVFELVSESKGWREFGSVHHHCNIGAFQSGTDHKDEKTRPGVHITLGHLDKDVYDIHARTVFRGVTYATDFKQWVDGDAGKTNGCFPQLWADQCHDKPKVEIWKTGTAGYGYNGYNRSAMSPSRYASTLSVMNSPTTEEEVAESLYLNFLYEMGWSDEEQEAYSCYAAHFGEAVAWMDRVLSTAVDNIPECLTDENNKPDLHFLFQLLEGILYDRFDLDDIRNTLKVVKRDIEKKTYFGRPFDVDVEYDDLGIPQDVAPVGYAQTDDPGLDEWEQYMDSTEFVTR